MAEAPPEIPPFREVLEDGTVKLRLHDGQFRTMESRKRFVFMMAGPQGGKTCLGPPWLHGEMNTALEKITNVGDALGDFLAVTSTFDLFKLKMLPEIRDFFEHDLRIGRYWPGQEILELTENLECDGKFWAKRQDDPMFARVILRSASAGSGLEATTALAAWLDEVGQEEFTLDSWEAVLRRLSISQGRVLGTTTVYNTGWMKLEVYDKWLAGDPDYDVIQFDSTENPAFPIEEFERARRDMPTWKFNMMYRGQFDRPAGLVYDSFNQEESVIDRFPIPDNWLWYVGHDFGSSNPAALAYAQDPGTGYFYLVHEYLPGSKAVPDQVDDLKTVMKDRIVIKRYGGAVHEQGWRDDYTQNGWPIFLPPINKVDVGISRVYALHKRGRIFVFRDCRRYLDEKNTYSYKLGAGYDVLDEIQNKSRHHLMDCERAALSGVLADGGQGQGPSFRRTVAM